MSTDVLLSNLLNPPVLFSFWACWPCQQGPIWMYRSRFPSCSRCTCCWQSASHGGAELNRSGLSMEVIEVLGAAIVMSMLVPIYAFFLLRTKMSTANAAAVAASYGSVSAVTFIAASSFLSRLNIEYSGYMVAALALMESPAILVAVALHRMNAGNAISDVAPAEVESANSPQPGKSRKAPRSSNASGGPAHHSASLKHLLRESFLNGSVVLLIGSLIIGALCGDEGEKILNPFIKDIFKGMLCLFLLDMGLVSGRRLGALRETGFFAVVFGVCLPLINAVLGIGIAYLLHTTPGNAFLFCVLCASASYIAVPAAMRLAIPEASPGLYVTPALAITFPFNIVFGFPLYHSIIHSLWK